MIFSEFLLIPLLLLAIPIKSVPTATNQTTKSIVSTTTNKHNSLILTAEQRHERLLKVRLQNLDNVRYKPLNKLQQKFGSTKLIKPITNHVTNALHVNSPAKTKLRQPPENSSELSRFPHALVKVPKPNGKAKKRHKSPIHSSSTNQSALPPSRLYLLVDRELQKIQSSKEMTRTTMAPNIFRLKLPSNSTLTADNKYGVRPRIIVDQDDETEASGFNELEELDKNIVPFQPRNHNWHLKTDEYSKSQLITPPKKLDNRRELHRGENEV